MAFARRGDALSSCVARHAPHCRLAAETHYITRSRPVDVTDAAERAVLVKRVLAGTVGSTCLVNNAGVGALGYLLYELSADESSGLRHEHRALSRSDTARFFLLRRMRAAVTCDVVFSFYALRRWRLWASVPPATVCTRRRDLAVLFYGLIDWVLVPVSCGAAWVRVHSFFSPFYIRSSITLFR